MAAIHLRVYEQGGPALLFENVKGSKYRCASNIYGTLERSKFIFRDTLKQVQDLIDPYASCMILYTYDSVLFDVDYAEAKELLPQIKQTLEQGNFPVKVKVGNIYDKIKTISL